MMGGICDNRTRHASQTRRCPLGEQYDHQVRLSREIPRVPALVPKKPWSPPSGLCAATRTPASAPVAFAGRSSPGPSDPPSVYAAAPTYSGTKHPLAVATLCLRLKSLSTCLLGEKGLLISLDSLNRRSRWRRELSATVNRRRNCWELWSALRCPGRQSVQQTKLYKMADSQGFFCFKKKNIINHT